MRYHAVDRLDPRLLDVHKVLVPIFIVFMRVSKSLTFEDFANVFNEFHSYFIRSPIYLVLERITN